MHLLGNNDGAGFGVKGTSLNSTGVLGTGNNGAGVFSSSIGARWLKPLHHFTRLSALLTIALVVAGAKAQANGFTPGERIAAVSRIPDTLDVFAADHWGAMYWAGWGQDETGHSDPVWHGWHNITNLEAQTLFSGSAEGPVTAVSTSTGEVDLFTVANTGNVYTARTFDPVCCYAGWFQIGDLYAGTASYVAPSRAALTNSISSSREMMVRSGPLRRSPLSACAAGGHCPA